MSLLHRNLFGIVNKVDVAIQRFKKYEPEQGYYLAFSGGKDSICIKVLADMAGVDYVACYNFTAIDPPPLVKFIREHHPDVKFIRPVESYFKAFLHKGFPMRFSRWCCELLKEGAGEGVIVTGIRWAESNKRRARNMYEVCKTNKDKTFLHPIIDWTKGDVWEFIRTNNLPYPDLYDKGWSRIGCLMCPLASPRNRKRDMKAFPAYERAFRRLFRKLYTLRKEQGNKSVDKWKSGDEMFEWWVGKPPRKDKKAKGQCYMFDN